MKNKLFIFSALIISAFLFSACTVKDQAELKLLNKIDTKVDQKIEETVQETGNDTEDELIDQLNADIDPNLDADFKNLDTELNKF
jgi:hypothetical protein